jgi:hypothetical protein
MLSPTSGIYFIKGVIFGFIASLPARKRILLTVVEVDDRKYNIAVKFGGEHKDARLIQYHANLDASNLDLVCTFILGGLLEALMKEEPMSNATLEELRLELIKMLSELRTVP